MLGPRPVDYGRSGVPMNPDSHSKNKAGDPDGPGDPDSGAPDSGAHGYIDRDF